MTVLVGQRRPRLQTRPRYSAPTPSFPKCPQRPSFVIPRAVAECGMTKLGRWGYFGNGGVGGRGHGFRDCAHLPRANASARKSRALCTPPWILRECRGRWLLWLMRWLAGDGFRDCPSEYQRRHTARSRSIHGTSRSMTALCRVTVCAEADDGVGRATASRLQTRPRYSAPTPPFPKCPQRPNFVIPRAVAECGMTKLGRWGYFGNDGVGRGVTGACLETGTPLPYQHRHPPPHTPSPYTTPSYCAKSQYPWWSAEGAGFSG